MDTKWRNKLLIYPERCRNFWGRCVNPTDLSFYKPAWCWTRWCDLLVLAGGLIRKYEWSFGTLNSMKEYLKFVILCLLLGKTGLPAEICAAWFFSVCFFFLRKYTWWKAIQWDISSSCSALSPPAASTSVLSLCSTGKTSSKLHPPLPTYTLPSWRRWALSGMKE